MITVKDLKEKELNNLEMKGEKFSFTIKELLEVIKLKEEDERLTEVAEFINNISLDELKAIYVNTHFI